MNEVTQIPKHKNVWVALCAAQGQIGRIHKGSINPAFKSRYADLADVISAVTPPLVANGLCLFHTVVDGHMRTTLMHGESETRIDCDVPLIVKKDDAHGYKSATTYAKRIGVESVTGVAPDDDDDGNAAAKAAPKEEPRNNGIADAWRDAVMDSLPENATPRQTAEAFANAICEDFQGKGAKALDNRWERHKRMIDSMADRHPDLYEQIIDAFENRRNELTERENA